MTDKVSVSAKALHDLLQALMGPPHLIRELQVISSLHRQGAGHGEPDCLTTVLNEYNAAQAAIKAEATT